MIPRSWRFILIAIGFMVPGLISGAQDLHYTHFTVESGLQLPSNEVYGILFDRNNVLWATTDRGIWRYDSYTAKQFTLADGLKENTNFRIFVDSLGRIWVSSINNYLYQIIGDSVKRFPGSERIHQLGNSTGFIQQLGVSPDHSLYLCFNRPGLFRFRHGEPEEQVTAHRIGHEQSALCIFYKPNQYYWDMIRMPDTSQLIPSHAYTENGLIYLNCGITDRRNNFRKDLCPINEDEFLISYSHKVFHIKNGRIAGERSFPVDIIDVYAAANGDFWVGLEKEGAMRFVGGDFHSAPLQYLKGETVTGIAQDHERNYWFSTANNGIFQANTLDITVFTHLTNNIKDNVITSMVSDGNTLFLGTQSGLLLKGTEQQNRNYHFRAMNLPRSDGPVRKLYWTPDKHLIVLNNFMQEMDTTGRLKGIRTITTYPLEYLRKPDGEWLLAVTAAIYVGRGDRIIRIWDEAAVKLNYPDDRFLPAALNRVRHLCLDPDGRIWAGSQKSGLFTIDGTKVCSWSKRDSLFGRRIHDIAQTGKNMWISIADHGLAVVRPDSSFVRITQRDGLSSDIIDVLFAENDSVVWAGTNNGLNRITFNPDGGKPVLIDYYTMREGLPSNRIFQIIKHNGNIWLGTTQGAIRLKPEFTRLPDIPPIIHAGPLLVNGIPRKLVDSLVLSPDENNLVFRFKATTYRKPNQMKYRYRLIGADQDYIVTSNLESRYPELKFGKYTFCINASYNFNFDPTSEMQFSVVIRKHWYETRLFIFIIISLSLLVLIWIFRLILKATKLREEEKRQLLQAEKRSLLSQMNPHFIFNSLNSIQHFIVQNDQIQANNFLTNFSGLIRRILDNSRKNLIPLNEEISTLSLYLSMEKLRFEGGFNYQIIKDNRIDYNETMIPPMMLQPFVENAIWHGLMPSKSPGSLVIAFEHLDEYFRCTIEDNGIGREKAASIRGIREPHTSSGIRNIRERIELLNKMNKKEIRLQITDLNGPDGGSCGTLIELLLPMDLSV